MAADTSDISEFKIKVIPSDEDGCCFYLERYKPFRLASLKQDPDAFGSTYAREIEFDDKVWLGRIKNPSVTTFVAVNSHENDRIVASASLIANPNINTSINPDSKPYEMPLQGTSQSDMSTTSTDDGDDKCNNNFNNNNDDKEPLYFEMSAVYTNPEARRHGLAKSLLKAATEEARRKAREGRRRPLVLSVVVYATNSTAISLYQRCGFVRDPEGPKLGFNTFKNEPLEELEMLYNSEA